ncbi:GntR family transcriptional regulator [Paludicola sp. MB14-C6]|uniref:GntR family transcriptional regulator n=1 Tax=Paludihabitans sp. MB14-C6 TaxID=3070656 RepID=UPI0027DAB94C|nr:GntR family transcriptional regulator [Paludicola sp. MB14-C6]WMJ23996.1 GntR family transcriptional regulator [Paludicola sp. MB14-C6]
MNWNLTSDRPIYAQLIEQITQSIVSGEFRAGEKLPSVRDLAQEAAVNPNTMQKALAELERNGLVYTQRTAGRFITEDNAMLEKVKTQLATEQIQMFFEKMNQLGFSKEQTITLIKNTAEGN